LKKKTTEFLAKSTQKIQDLLANLNKDLPEEEKEKIIKAIDSIKEEMKIYAQEKKPGKQSKGKTEMQSPAQAKEEPAIQPSPKRKKYEVYLEGIDAQLQTYGAIIPKLKVFNTYILIEYLQH
jgi:hypothetical protein